MSRQEATEQYALALKSGQKYYRTAVSRGEYPYPPALDEVFPDAMTAPREELGLVDVPVELAVGIRSPGRGSALAGNFMPLLPANSEFAAKWIALCEAHFGEGIREPIQCYEYMGLFYVQEGNKRLSVLRSLGNPTVRARVTRLLPAWSEDHEVQVYYEFLRFYRLSRMYGVTIRHRRGYARLQALLGYEEDHVWTEEERRQFLSGFARFRQAFEKSGGGKLPLTAGEALLVWLSVFSFAEIRDKTLPELIQSIESVRPDLRVLAERRPIEVSTEPDPAEKGLWSRLWGGGGKDRVHAAFIYGFSPEQSAWTRSHDHGRHALEREMGDRVTTSVHLVREKNYLEAMEEAVAAGADVIFATTPPMIAACRRIAAEHRNVRVLNCSLSQPYTGVRTYYSRTYETKFITGAIAGAMAAEDTVGYIAGYPIMGVPCSINAFALGARMTNPRARVKLLWTCVEGDPLAELIREGVTVISNRDATAPGHAHFSLEWGTYRRESDGTFLPLAIPSWDWGAFYGKVIRSILNGVWGEAPAEAAINYWWGLDSGVLDVRLGDALPEGVRTLAEVLRRGLVSGAVDPFRSRILDQAGTLRFDGDRSPAPEELMRMDWLCDNVDGIIPPFEQLRSASRGLVRLLGVYRDRIPPEREEGNG